MGKFSSDRAIREYSEAVWHVKPVKVELDKLVQGDAGFKVQTPKTVLC
jgi:starch phosphorylase